LVVSGELVVAGGNAAEILEATEHRLDAPAFLVACFIIADGTLAVLASGDYRYRVLATQRSSDAIGIVASIGDEPLHAGSVPDQLISGLHIRCIARREDEAERSAENIDERMDFRRATAARDANGIDFRPPFPPPAQRWALM